MKLPVAFTDKMKRLLGEAEYEELIEALSGERQYGLRMNTLKAAVDDFINVSPFNLEPVPWTSDGFYISGDDAPGRHPYYHAGLYYIQEPSAMLPGNMLGAHPGEKVLDLCAAPGGKTVQIAAAMKGRGLLVSNDINAERVKALIKNIELCGVRNAIVLNETPEKLIHNFEGYFDRILVDAPCSGEGMFRKDETAARSWESFKCERCTQLQEPILHSADRLLKAGGTLVYSTCTFSPEEDEQMIVKFMHRHPGYELVEIPKIAGMEGGRPQWADKVTGSGEDAGSKSDTGSEAGSRTSGQTSSVTGSQTGGRTGGQTSSETSSHAGNRTSGQTSSEASSQVDSETSGQTSSEAGSQAGSETSNGTSSGTSNGKDIRRTARLWPHRVRGEGHFVAKLIKTGVKEQEYTFKPEYEETLSYDMLPQSFHTFVKENINQFPEGIYLVKGHNLYHFPGPLPKLDGLKVAKFGWFLGTIEDNRFEPSHSMVTALKKEDLKRTVNLKADDSSVNRYLKGETLMLEGEKGLTAVCVDGWTLGWAKQTGDMLKNLYPKGWRKLS